jgi:hypothetical protein
LSPVTVGFGFDNEPPSLIQRNPTGFSHTLEPTSPYRGGEILASNVGTGVLPPL